MLCPAAVSAAAAAVWLLAVLGPGLSHPAEDNSEEGFSHCSHCFYRQTPPEGASAGPPLRSLCHTLPGGQTFATLSKPTCDTAVYSAFHLSHGWTEGEEGGELVTEEDNNIKVPALLRGGVDPSHPVSPTDSPLKHWDSRVATLVQSSIIPHCNTLEGDLYILTGAGGLGAAEDGDDECQTKLLWSAVCCAAPEGRSGFSMGLIREAGEGEKQVSVKELEEMLGVAELFSEDCGGADGETVGIRVGMGEVGSDVTGGEEVGSDAGEGEEADSDGTEGEEAGSDTSEGGEAGSDHSEQEEAGSDATKQEEVSLGATEGEEVGSAPTGGEEVRSAATGEEDVRSSAAGGEEVGSSATSQDSTSEGSAEEQRDGRYSSTARSQSPESSADYETVDEQETDTNSSSMLVYILSTTMSIIKAPLRPVFSTITQLPGQVSYVLQEDLGVLSALPGETFSLLHLLTSDLFSWIGSAGETVLSIGGTCCSSIYYCSSSMLGALLNSCHTGVTGVGTLAGDTVGIFGGALDNVWWVTKVFGGRLWEQSEGYVGTVVSEMGGQAKAVGGGMGSLAWRSGNGVGKVFRLGGGVIMGVVDVLIGAVRGAFGEESE
ncbi:uncharacterized protein LOC125893117 [Epinephelus fuscoguttatus]|uniref:uncharacterized protein LOC125893117 n=1 Tax=Epinephelus fuscoguttatus TaxID=293821 RepID=UPI0020D19C79|nr:uncharacterized protein LOC125893117 [Epinephelus fuscoguttatus]